MSRLENNIQNAFARFLKEDPKANLLGAPWAEYKAKCKERVVKSLWGWYQDSDYERINLDAIDIWFIEDTRIINTARGIAGQIVLQYGNLYSVAVANGKILPYNEWIYEEEVNIEGIIYTWGKFSHFGTMEIDQEKIPDLNLKITSVPVKGKVRKLKIKGGLSFLIKP